MSSCPLILPSICSNMLLKVFVEDFSSVIVFFGLKKFFMFSVSSLSFSFCSYIIFPILLNSLSIFSCISLNFLKIAIWILYLIKADLHDSGFIYQKITMIPLWYHVTLIFHILCSFMLLSSYLKEQSLHPVFTECLQKRNTFHCPC